MCEIGYHAVLGANGAIGKAVLNALEAKGLEGRGLSSRDADARDLDQLTRALEGAEVVYTCVGLPYSHKVWAEGFPKISNAAVTACENVGAKLAYFDNIYMYGPSPLPVPFTEETPHNPPSRKGKVRKECLDIVNRAHAEGRVQVTVGRSPEFYGPGATNSALYMRFIEAMIQGKRPQTIMVEGPVHTYSYTGDMGRGLVELATNEDCYGQEYHLPVGPPVKVSEIVEICNKILGTSHKASFLPPFVISAAALIVPLMKEVDEMSYQFKNDYVMSDAKFRARFPEFQSTSYEDGIAATIDYFRSV